MLYPPFFDPERSYEENYEKGPFGAFGDGLSKLIASVDSSAGDANTAVTGMIDGTGDVHTAMIALQKAEMNLELTVQIRNKLVQAYQDVMRMTI